MTKTPAPRFWTREEAGLFTPNPQRLSTRTDLVIGVTLHRTGSRTSDPLAKWKAIQQEAMLGTLPSGDKYGDTPYNAGIVIDGPHAAAILPGRDPRWVGAHATSTKNVANRITLGLCVIGDGSLTPAARAAIAGYVYVAALTYKRGMFLFDHLDFKALGGIPTSCPGDEIADYIAELRGQFRK